MAEISYETIKPLITKQEQIKRSVHCVFRCPVSGTEVASSAGIRRGRGAKDVALSSAKRSFWHSVRNAVAGVLRQILGSGAAGRVGQDVAREVIKDASHSVRYSDDELEAAAVLAFERVVDKFRWDGNRWVASSVEDPDSAFDQQLGAAPITTQYDKGVLARMLVEVAKADRELKSQEEDFLCEFIEPELGTVAELAKLADLTPVELEETSEGAVRESMLMLAWTLALCDEDLAVGELSRLRTLAKGLGVSDARAEQLQGHAQVFLVDKALGRVYASGSRDAAALSKVMALAKTIGLDATAAERADVRYRKRHGIV